VVERCCKVTIGYNPIRRAPDAYPEIAAKRQWNKLVLYSGATGWDEGLCAQMPTVCNTLRGKLRSEQVTMFEGDERSKQPRVTRVRAPRRRAGNTPATSPASSCRQTRR
jgi:hypothetical protein